jgi:ADP-ribosylglycohydrolase
LAISCKCFSFLGLIYGTVLGDTLGVATEYLMTDEINFYYGGGRLDHHSIVQDEHRSHFPRGKTTCVSEFAASHFLFF